MTVHRRRHTVPPHQTALRRALFEASILVHSALTPPRIRPDVVLTQMPSLAGECSADALHGRPGYRMSWSSRT